MGERTATGHSEMLINLPTVSALAHSQCAGDRLISRIIHSNASVKYYMRRPDLASLLGRSVLIASFEKDKDGKQRSWEVLASNGLPPSQPLRAVPAL